jgi:hypothetical protein
MKNIYLNFIIEVKLFTTFYIVLESRSICEKIQKKIRKLTLEKYKYTTKEIA